MWVFFESFEAVEVNGEREQLFSRNRREKFLSQAVNCIEYDRKLLQSSAESEHWLQNRANGPKIVEAKIQIAFVSIHILLFTTRKLYKILRLTKGDENEEPR